MKYYLVPWLCDVGLGFGRSNYPLLVGFLVYGEHLRCVKWGFRQAPINPYLFC